MKKSKKLQMIAFTLNCLNKYIETTKKNENKEIIEKLKNDISCLKNNPNDDLSKKIISHIELLMENYKGIKSRRLFVLFHFIKTQINELQLLESMGISAIFPEDEDTPSVLKNREKRTSSLSTFIGSILNFPNRYNNFSHTYKEGLSEEIISSIDSLSIIYVTPGTHNPYGHSLLKLGGKNSYLHINTLYGKPQYMESNEFAAYLKINHCEIAHIQNLDITDIDSAKNTIQKLSGQKWLWGITHHNCLSFAQTVAVAGGMTYTDLGCDHGTKKLPSDFYTRDNIRDKIDKKNSLSEKENELYNVLQKEGLPDQLALAKTKYQFNKTLPSKLYVIAANLEAKFKNISHNAQALSRVGVSLFQPVKIEPFSKSQVDEEDLNSPKQPSMDKKS